MIRLITHVPETGEILCDVRCAEGDLALYENAIVIDDGVSVNNHYILDGQFIEIPPKIDKHSFNYATHEWEFDSALALGMVRIERNQLIASTDWTQLPDAKESVKQAFAPYRQALRDITDGPIEDVVFPIPPTL
jgi:hypothetical protein